MTEYIIGESYWFETKTGFREGKVKHTSKSGVTVTDSGTNNYIPFDNILRTGKVTTSNSKTKVAQLLDILQTTQWYYINMSNSEGRYTLEARFDEEEVSKK